MDSQIEGLSNTQNMENGDSSNGRSFNRRHMVLESELDSVFHTQVA